MRGPPNIIMFVIKYTINIAIFIVNDNISFSLVNVTKYASIGERHANTLHPLINVQL